MYLTYRRCFLRSTWLSRSYTLLTYSLLAFVFYSSAARKDHLLLEDVADAGGFFAKLEEQRGKEPTCSALNATGMCLEWSWLEACQWQDSGLFIATHVEEALEVGGAAWRALPASGPRQAKWKRNASRSFYVAEPEAWIMVLEHRLRSSLIGTFAGQDLRGFLRDGPKTGPGQLQRQHAFNGQPESHRHTFGRNGSAGPGDNRLRIPLWELLAAAGVELDEPCERCAEFGVLGEAARLRRVGIELDVAVFYSNLWGSWSSPTSWLLPSEEVVYELRVAARQVLEGVRTIRLVEHSELQVSAPAGVGSRVVQRSHGIRLVFRQEGVIGKLDLAHFIKFVVTSLSFITLAWTLTEVAVEFWPMLCDWLRRPKPSWYDFLTSEAEEHKEKAQ